MGCFLSGGIDSSLLVALAVASRPDLRTFTIGFDDPASDERAYARLVASHFATHHAEAQLARQDMEARLTELPEIFDEPFDANGAIPFMAVAALARQHDTTVALGGTVPMNSSSVICVMTILSIRWPSPLLPSHG